MPYVNVLGARQFNEFDPTPPQAITENLIPNWRYHFFVLDWTPASISIRLEGAGTSPAQPAWNVNDEATHRPITFRTANHSEISVSKPASPTHWVIQCRVGSQSYAAELWFVRARVRVRVTDDLSPTNGPGIRALASAGRRPGETRLGPVIRPGWGRDNAGQRSDRTSYGMGVEIVGEIQPTGVPCRFHIPREIVRSHTWFTRIAGGPVHSQEHRSNEDDTSDPVHMTQIQDVTGKIFDTDSPGAEFQEADRAGARHRWQFEARQFVAIGPRPSSDAIAASNGLRSRISPYRSWNTRFVATVTRADGISPPTVAWASDGVPVLAEGAEAR